MLQVAASERQLVIAQSKQRGAGDDGSGLPIGWVEQPSSSRPGQVVFVNTYTDEAIAWKPTSPASKDAGNLPPPPAGHTHAAAPAKRRSKSTKEIQDILKKRPSSLAHPISPKEVLKLRGVKREASMPSFKETCGNCVVL